LAQIEIQVRSIRTEILELDVCFGSEAAGPAPGPFVAILYLSDQGVSRSQLFRYPYRTLIAIRQKIVTTICKTKWAQSSTAVTLRRIYFRKSQLSRLTVVQLLLSELEFNGWLPVTLGWTVEVVPRHLSVAGRVPLTNFKLCVAHHAGGRRRPLPEIVVRAQHQCAAAPLPTAARARRASRRRAPGSPLGLS